MNRRDFEFSARLFVASYISSVPSRIGSFSPQTGQVAPKWDRGKILVLLAFFPGCLSDLSNTLGCRSAAAEPVLVQMQLSRVLAGN